MDRMKKLCTTKKVLFGTLIVCGILLVTIVVAWILLDRSDAVGLAGVVTGLAGIVVAFLSMVFAIIGIFLIPFVKSKVGEEKFKDISKWVRIALNAAEQIYNESGM